METSKVVELENQIIQLKSELQHQKGMLWIIGEIIKNATNIASFQELMKIITDMLMGVMGTSACYLWIYNGNGEYTLHFRSIFMLNKYTEVHTNYIPQFLQSITNSKPFQDTHLETALIESTPLPGSRLVAPLYDFQLQSPIGFLIVEHAAPDFFKNTTSSLFETLAIFIGSHSYNSKLFETVSMETERDPLTKALNRKFLSRFLKEYKPQSSPLSLCIFDIDSFKLVNDIYGHEKGDDVLIAVCEAASNIINPLGGKVIRYGGDEFVLLLNLPLEQAIPALNQLRTIIPALPVMDHFKTPTTITMGVSEYPKTTGNIHKLLAYADNALLEGKCLGKNILEIA